MDETTPVYRFRDSDVGCWLAGHMGWHNNYRVVDLATELGMAITTGDRISLDIYREQGNDCPETVWSDMLGQGELVDESTEYLQSLCMPGLTLVWDMGELCLVPDCQLEDEPTPIPACPHCERGQFT